MYWLTISSASLLLTWVHTHTDEIPIVLGLVAVVSGIVGLLFPRRLLVTWMLLSPVIFAAETLVHWHMLNAPYPASEGLPWPALIASVPAGLGVAIGGMVLSSKTKSLDIR